MMKKLEYSKFYQWTHIRQLRRSDKLKIDGCSHEWVTKRHPIEIHQAHDHKNRAGAGS